MQTLQQKMQQNIQAKQFSQEVAENELVLAENAIKIGKGIENSNSQWQEWRPCVEGKCYLITVRGHFGQALTVLQEIYMLKSLPQTHAVQAYRLGWWETTHE